MRSYPIFLVLLMIIASQLNSQTIEKGCKMLPEAKVKAVFGAFDDVTFRGTYLQEKNFGSHGRIPGQNLSACDFKRNATGEVLKILGNLYENDEDASKAFATASKAPGFYTKGVKMGPIQILEGKGRSFGYLGTRTVKVEWLIGEDTKDMAGSNLTPLVVTVICPNYPDCKVSASKP